MPASLLRAALRWLRCIFAPISTEARSRKTSDKPTLTPRPTTTVRYCRSLTQSRISRRNCLRRCSSSRWRRSFRRWTWRGASRDVSESFLESSRFGRWLEFGCRLGRARWCRRRSCASCRRRPEGRSRASRPRCPASLVAGESGGCDGKCDPEITNKNKFWCRNIWFIWIMQI